MLARFLAVGSLTATLLAVVVIVTASGTSSEDYRTQLTRLMQKDARALAGLTSALKGLRPGDSPAPAKEALEQALEAHQQARLYVSETLPGREWPVSEKADTALDRQAAWMDVVGSVLNNPGSELRKRARSRAERTRKSFSELNLPGIGGEVVGGEDAFLAHARARLE